MRQTSNTNDFINAKSHDGKKPLHTGLTTSYDENFFVYRKTSIKPPLPPPPGGLIYFKPIWVGRGGVIHLRGGGAYLI